MKRVDALVVGCGAMDSSTGYNLTSTELNVMILEELALNHEFGSSPTRSRGDAPTAAFHS